MSNGYSGDRVPSMKMRMEGKDYSKRGIYMLTLAVEGRRPLLASVTGTQVAQPASSVGFKALIRPLSSLVLP